jgi:hypothetical protein
MGLITKKDVIRNMASLKENEGDWEENENDEFETQEDGLLDDDRRRSGDST